MPKCENCYHYVMCLAAFCENKNICRFYKDKSLIAELPCRVGDMVYYVPPGTAGCINTLTVVAIHLSDEKSVRKKLHKSHFVAIESRSKLSGKYNLDSFGKTVFLTREAAERALEEREKNETQKI